jgi:hypothetical protein
MSEAVLLLPYMPSWHRKGNLYPFLAYYLRTLYEHSGLGERKMIKLTLKKQ